MSPCTAVYGIFVTPNSLEACIEALSSAGMASDGMSLLMSDKGGWHDFTCGDSAKSAAAGVEVGGVVGGLVGLLLGLGALVIPGAGPLVAAGPIMASLAGATVGGALGGLVGALVDLGLPEYEAKLYDSRLKDGAVLLSVHCLSAAQLETTRNILLANGAEDLASSGEEEVEEDGAETRASF